MEKPFVSIIIPVYKNWDNVKICLNALSEQTYNKNYFEIILVNNSPPNKIPNDLILPSNCILLEEKKPGSYAARNEGLRNAKGEIIGFTDADCLPQKKWIESAVELICLNSEVFRVGGRVQLFYLKDKPSPVEIYDTLYSLKQKDYIKNFGAAATANMFTRKQVFDVIGMFNDDLLSGGDIEWGKKANLGGYNIFYGEDVVVLHPARFALEDLKTKVKRVSGGHFRLNDKKRNILWFYWNFFKGMKPPFSDFAYIKKHNWITGKDKICVYALRYYLQILSRYETLRLKLGRNPERR